MAILRFTENIQRHISCPQTRTHGATLRDNLNDAFSAIPKLKGYILNNQGELLPHMNIFIDGQVIHDRKRLDDEVSDDSEIFIIQALSGG